MGLEPFQEGFQSTESMDLLQFGAPTQFLRSCAAEWEMWHNPIGWTEEWNVDVSNDAIWSVL